MDKLNPSIVKFLIFKRGFVFLDEWLTYLLFLYLYFKKEYKLIAVLAPFAISFNINGYVGLWGLEKLCVPEVKFPRLTCNGMNIK